MPEEGGEAAMMILAPCTKGAEQQIGPLLRSCLIALRPCDGSARCNGTRSRENHLPSSEAPVNLEFRR